MATTDEQWATSVQTALTIGAPFIGAGSTPNDFTTKEQWVAYAEKIDHLGELSRAQGVQYMVHSHDWEFTQVFDGETGYDILQANTSPENVVFELDLYWATKAGADPLEVIESYGDRIELLHVKDLGADGSITTVGEGTIDFAPIFAAAGEDIQYYVIERDPPFTDPTFDPPGDYPGAMTLTKTKPATVTPAELGPIDAVLLSHDEHADNLDDSGRKLLCEVPVVLTTPSMDALQSTALRLVAALADTDADPAEVERLVAGDPGLSMKVLRAASSSAGAPG